MKRFAVVAFAVLLCCHPRHQSVTIATTTSVDGSGLLQAMRVAFERKTGILLNAFVVGSGRALRLASEGKADLTITHDPETERIFVAKNKPLSLWRAAGLSRQSNPNYIPIGQAMAHLLRSADEFQAYAPSDRATFDQLAPSLHVVILFDGDPTLRNVYAVTLMRRADSEEHRKSFRIRGHQELHWID